MRLRRTAAELYSRSWGELLREVPLLTVHPYIYKYKLSYLRHRPITQNYRGSFTSASAARLPFVSVFRIMFLVRLARGIVLQCFKRCFKRYRSLWPETQPILVVPLQVWSVTRDRVGWREYRQCIHVQTRVVFEAIVSEKGGKFHIPGTDTRPHISPQTHRPRGYRELD